MPTVLTKACVCEIATGDTTDVTCACVPLGVSGSSPKVALMMFRCASHPGDCSGLAKRFDWHTCDVGIGSGCAPGIGELPGPICSSIPTG